MSGYIRPEKLSFSFVRGGLSADESYEGLESYSYAPADEGATLGGAPTINGNRLIMDKLDNGGNLSLIVQRDSDLAKQLQLMMKVRTKLVGFFTDSTGETLKNDYTVKSAAIARPTLDSSAENITYIIRGNIIDKTL